MGQCCSKQNYPKKQNKDIDDRKMFKAAVEVMGKEFSVGIGYNRKARKDYSDVVHVDNSISKNHKNNERTRSENHEIQTEVQEFGIKEPQGPQEF